MIKPCLRFDIITIFPEIFDSFLKESLLKRARARGLLKIQVHNLRKWTKNRHKTVDDKPFGGGLGMVMKVEPIFKAVKTIKVGARTKKARVILFTPRGKKFTQKIASQYSKLDQLILICGRYEGIDERVAKYIADEQISIGDYVLMGGEVAAMAVVESIARLIPGVVGKASFLQERNKGVKGFTEYPQYTRPEIFAPFRRVKWRAPKVLLSGNHKKIEGWRKKHGRIVGK